MKQSDMYTASKLDELLAEQENIALAGGLEWDDYHKGSSKIKVSVIVPTGQVIGPLRFMLGPVHRMGKLKLVSLDHADMWWKLTSHGLEGFWQHECTLVEALIMYAEVGKYQIAVFRT